MCVEGLSAEQGLWQARDQVQLRGGTELSTDQRRALDHRSELRPGYLDGQVPQAAVRIDDQPVGRYDVERPADPTGDNLRRFELVALHVDDPEPDLPVPSVFGQQREVVVPFAGEFEGEPVDPGVEDGGEQEGVVS